MPCRQGTLASGSLGELVAGQVWRNARLDFSGLRAGNVVAAMVRTRLSAVTRTKSTLGAGTNKKEATSVGYGSPKAPVPVLNIMSLCSPVDHTRR